MRARSPPSSEHTSHSSSDGRSLFQATRTRPQRAIELIQTIARTLPLRQREVFILCDVEGRKPAEAAAMLDVKDVSVRASLFKARSSIRRSILATHPCYREQLG